MIFNRIHSVIYHFQKETIYLPISAFILRRSERTIELIERQVTGTNVSRPAASLLFRLAARREVVGGGCHDDGKFPPEISVTEKEKPVTVFRLEHYIVVESTRYFFFLLQQVHYMEISFPDFPISSL